MCHSCSRMCCPDFELRITGRCHDRLLFLRGADPPPASSSSLTCTPGITTLGAISYPNPLAMLDASYGATSAAYASLWTQSQEENKSGKRRSESREGTSPRKEKGKTSSKKETKATAAVVVPATVQPFHVVFAAPTGNEEQTVTRTITIGACQDNHG